MSTFNQDDSMHSDGDANDGEFFFSSLSLSLTFYRVVRKEFSVYHKEREREKEEKTHETPKQHSVRGKDLRKFCFVLIQSLRDVNFIY